MNTLHRDGTRTISITSGKGGVGKTSLVCNMAYELGRRGNKVLILDGDLGMANVDIMFGQRARLNISHVLENRCQLEDILVDVAPNVQLIPGGSGVYELARLQPLHKQILMDQVSRLNRGFDYMLVDTAPGIDDNVLYLNAAAQEILVVVTPDPTSLTDAYALIKVLHQRYKENRFSIVANMVRDEQEARHVFQKLSDVASRFLCVSLEYRGSIPTDLNLRQSIRSQQMVVQAQSRCPASLAIRSMVEKVSQSDRYTELKGGMQFFWNQLSGVA
ncbi:MAG: MinD/ParA family protein [Bdellovibrionales bacterium]|nr:MinD/ParA family protein [Bdellovibrionales bacterium]